MEHKHLGYIARVNLGFDVRRNREETLKWCKEIYSHFPELVPIPNLSYEDFEGEKNWLFYYSDNKEDLEILKKELDCSGLIKEVNLGAIKEHVFSMSKTK